MLAANTTPGASERRRKRQNSVRSKALQQAPASVARAALAGCGGEARRRSLSDLGAAPRPEPRQNLAEVLALAGQARRGAEH